MAIYEQDRGRTAEQRAAANDIVPRRTVATEADSGLQKHGDGVTRWNDLPYFPDNTEIGTTESHKAGLGFIDYNNTSGDIAVEASTWTTVTNNALGGFTRKRFTIPGVPELMDSNGALDFQHLELGDGLLVRTDLTITPTVNGQTQAVRWVLGDTYSYPLTTALGMMVGGAGVPTQVVFLSYLYMGDANTHDGTGVLQFMSSEDCTLNNAGSAIQILKQGL